MEKDSATAQPLSISFFFLVDDECLGAVGLSLIDFILLLKQLSWVLEGDEDKEVKIKQRIKKELTDDRE